MSKRRRRGARILRGNQLQRAIELSDHLDSRLEFNRDQRIEHIRWFLVREYELGRKTEKRHV